MLQEHVLLHAQVAHYLYHHLIFVSLTAPSTFMLINQLNSACPNAHNLTMETHQPENVSYNVQ